MSLTKEIAAEEKLARELKLEEYRDRREVIDAHLNNVNALSASVIAIGDDAWHEMRRYARPAEMLESLYHLKKAVEPYGRYDDIAEGPIFELTQHLNVLCCKWHAILFYPVAYPSGESAAQEGLFPDALYAVVDDVTLHENDAALREDRTVGQVTFDDTAFIGKGLLPVFWQEVDCVRNRANAAREITLAEIQRLKALNKPLETEVNVW